MMNVSTLLPHSAPMPTRHRNQIVRAPLGDTAGIGDVTYAGLDGSGHRIQRARRLIIDRERADMPAVLDDDRRASIEAKRAFA